VQDIPTRGDVWDVPAQLALIAKGFTGPENETVDAFAPYANVHLAGDARMGATLVSRAMADALQVAGEIANELLG
jgi:glutamate synthase (NADPH/NADH) small chain